VSGSVIPRLCSLSGRLSEEHDQIVPAGSVTPSTESFRSCGIVNEAASRIVRSPFKESGLRAYVPNSVTLVPGTQCIQLLRTQSILRNHLNIVLSSTTFRSGQRLHSKWPLVPTERSVYANRDLTILLCVYYMSLSALGPVI
jgi:hypothetical protein